MEPASSTNMSNGFRNLFETPDAAMTDMINWAHANAALPQVAAWLEACTQWDVAVATKDHHRQKTRQKLCKDHNIEFTRKFKENEKLDATIPGVRHIPDQP